MPCALCWKKPSFPEALITYRSEAPDKLAYYSLYQTTGWEGVGRFTPDDLERAILNSQKVVCVYDGERLVGFGRVLTDGVMHAMIYEMIVHPEYQGRGIGSQVVRLLVEWCQLSGIRDIQLFCARGKVEFYRKNSFIPRPEDAPGMQYHPVG